MEHAQAWGISHLVTAVVRGKDAILDYNAGEGDPVQPTFTREIN